MDNTLTLNKDDIALIGICSDSNSSFMKGTAKAPNLIRKALYQGSSNLCSELGVELNNNIFFKDVGDREIGEDRESYLKIENEISHIVKIRAKPLILGGDHAITYPILKAITKKYGAVNLLHFDAHPDLYHEFECNSYSHACPFARIMEDGLAKRLVQVGIRTLDAHQRAQAKKFCVEQNEIRNFDINTFNPSFDGAVYISFDMDALDPSFAPGVSHHEPGGLSVREVVSIIQNIDATIVGADIVEYNPKHDINGMTAMVAAKLLKEIVGKMLKPNEKAIK